MKELWLHAIRCPKPIRDYDASYVMEMTLDHIYLVRRILMDSCHVGTPRESAYTQANQLLVETWYKDRQEDAEGNSVFFVEITTLMCSIIKNAAMDYLRSTMGLKEEGVLTAELMTKLSTVPEKKRADYICVVSNVLVTFTALESFFCGMMEMEDMIDRGQIQIGD